MPTNREDNYSALLQLPAQDSLPPKTISDYCMILQELIMAAESMMDSISARVITDPLAALAEDIQQLSEIADPEQLDYLLTMLAASINSQPIAVLREIDDWIVAIQSAATIPDEANNRNEEAISPDRSDSYCDLTNINTHCLTSVSYDEATIANIFSTQLYKATDSLDTESIEMLSTLSFSPNVSASEAMKTYEATPYDIEQFATVIKAVINGFEQSYNE